MIERIERLKLNGNSMLSQSVEKLGPSQKFPKCLINTLESVHPDEVGNIGSRSSTR